MFVFGSSSYIANFFIIIILTAAGLAQSLGRTITQGQKMARYSFSGSIPPKFDHKLRHHKQKFGKITTTVVLDEDENLS